VRNFGSWGAAETNQESFVGACPKCQGAEPNDIHLAGSPTAVVVPTDRAWITRPHTDAARTWAVLAGSYSGVLVVVPKNAQRKRFGVGLMDLRPFEGVWASVSSWPPRNRPARENPAADLFVHWVIAGIEYAIVASLLLVAGVVLVRTVIDFFSHWHQFPQSVGRSDRWNLVVIILLDIAHTVFGHLRASLFPLDRFSSSHPAGVRTF